MSEIKPEVKLKPGTNVSTLIEKDMQDCYLRYSMSVIVARALPDVRDGFKPVHRRVMYGMYDLGLFPGKPYKQRSCLRLPDAVFRYF